jgi:hypothetical protein
MDNSQLSILHSQLNIMGYMNRRYGEGNHLPLNVNYSAQTLKYMGGGVISNLSDTYVAFKYTGARCSLPAQRVPVFFACSTWQTAGISDGLRRLQAPQRLPGKSLRGTHRQGVAQQTLFAVCNKLPEILCLIIY